jgi:squalene-hopene/tetraprenyl-beta-curcumene cyclase
MPANPLALDAAERLLVERLLDRRTSPDHWDGHLSDSALSTATAVLALHLVATARDDHEGGSGGPLDAFVEAGVRWLIAHQNADGGWGDTVRSRSNISTTAIVWATLSMTGGDAAAGAVDGARRWLDRVAGDSTPEALRRAILRRYGKDRTFSIPILTVLALARQLDADTSRAWRLVPQLPFELAALPHGWFQHLSLPVVSYALPALIAIGQVRHHFAPSRNPIARVVRKRVRRRTLRVLRVMQPDSGGYLEATPLTSFVVMSLAGMGETSSAVVEAGVRFLTGSMRTNGGWPIDTNLATWVTTLSIGALKAADGLPSCAVEGMRGWLLAQQSEREHPFTHAAPGAWAWTPLSGGVPDADDTSGALLALARLGATDARARAAAAHGVRWLLDLQNRDGGIPTFCRGWGTLPFDSSTPEITSHALEAWSAWAPYLTPALQREVQRAALRALRFIASSQRSDGAWIPLWFGNEHAPGDHNLTYGTARVVLGLESVLVREDPRAVRSRRAGVAWLLAAQGPDGGWGGDRETPPTLEETGAALAALAGVGADTGQVREALDKGAEWLVRANAGDVPAAPVGLYFARLWYYEDLYPLAFALSGLAAARRALEHREPGGLQPGAGEPYVVSGFSRTPAERV